MMGYTHVTSGLVAGLATLPLVPADHWPAQASWVIGIGGIALLPDLDSRGATASRMWGPITGVLAAGVAHVARGHRWGTHDAILAPTVVAVLVWLASHHPWTEGAVLALAIGLSLRGLVLVGAGSLGAFANLTVSVAGAWWITTHVGDQLAPLPLVAAAGVLVHIIGDSLTEEGVPIPILWLLGNRRRIGARLFTTGQPFERGLVAPGLSLAGVWLFCAHTGIHDVSSLVGFVGGAVRVLVLT